MERHTEAAPLRHVVTVWIAGVLRWSRVFDKSVAECVAHGRKAASGVYGREAFREDDPLVLLIVRNNADRVVAQCVYRGAGRGLARLVVDLTK